MKVRCNSLKILNLLIEVLVNSYLSIFLNCTCRNKSILRNNKLADKIHKNIKFLNINSDCMSNRLSLISRCGRLFSTLCRLSRLALLYIRMLLCLLLFLNNILSVNFFMCFFFKWSCNLFSNCILNFRNILNNLNNISKAF